MYCSVSVSYGFQKKFSLSFYLYTEHQNTIMDTKKTLIALVVIHNIVSLISLIIFENEFEGGLMSILPCCAITFILSSILIAKINKKTGERKGKATWLYLLQAFMSYGALFIGFAGTLWAYLIGYVPIISIIPLLKMYNKVKDNPTEADPDTSETTVREYHPFIYNPEYFICPSCQAPYLKYAFNNHCKWCGARFNRDGDITGYTKPFFRIFNNTTVIRQYNTLSDESNHMFLSYIFNNFSDCDIKTRVSASEIAENAPEYAMPINFLITKGDRRVAVLLMESKKEMRYSLLETMELCNENNITPLRFIIGREDFFTNEETYVVNRIRKGLSNTVFKILDKTIKKEIYKEEKREDWNFRNIQDITNVKKYETLSHEINHKFLSYIFNNLIGYDIKTRVSTSEIAANAPEYAMPINFLITKGEKRVAILLVNRDKCKRYAVLETTELCKENNIVPLRFMIEFPNEEEYVVKRIKATFEE